MRRVLVNGGGVDAWMTAAALAKAGRGALKVLVTDQGPTPEGRIGALPALRGMHARLGISEASLASEASARPRLGARYNETLEPFGQTGAALDGVAFHHHWRAAGEPAELEAWSLAAQAAARGRFAPESADPRSPLSTLDHGLTLDAAAYANLLKAVALKAGAEIAPPHARAEFIIDTAATSPGDHWIDWSAWLPTGRRLADDTGLVSTFKTAPLSAGRRMRAVSGNRVAIGAAYAAIGAGDGGDLHLLQGAITRLITLFPNTPAAAAEFERLSAASAERARDMAILRWGDLSAPPEELAWKITQFESRGRVVMYDEEAWPENAFVHAFLARGITPRRADPLALRQPIDRTRDMLIRMRRLLEQTAEAMPRA